MCPAGYSRRIENKLKSGYNNVATGNQTIEFTNPNFIYFSSFLITSNFIL